MNSFYRVITLGLGKDTVKFMFQGPILSDKCPDFDVKLRDGAWTTAIPFFIHFINPFREICLRYSA